MSSPRHSWTQSAPYGLPVAGVSYGGNDPAEAEMPLDWGTEVPLRFLTVRRVVVVLQGAANGRGELLAYAAPSYYGMAVAVVGRA